MENNEKETASNSGLVNIEELRATLQQTFIHIDLKKTFYTITPSELIVLEEGSSNIWKDTTLASLGLGIPTLINAAIELGKVSPPMFTAEIFINSLVGTICCVLSIIGGVLWRKNVSTCKVLIKELKERPQYKV
jgi:hypothetical protein